MEKPVAYAVKLGRRTFVEEERLDLVLRWHEWQRLTMAILCDETGK